MHSSMTTIFPINLQCPICESDFKSNEIGSCGYGSKRADFRPNYWEMNPVYYFYHLCPSCGFCAAKELFKLEIRDKKLKKEIHELKKLENSDLSMKLERAMICLELMNEHQIVNMNEYEFGNSWINTFWWAKDNKAKKLGVITIKYFNQALDKDLVPEDEIPTIKYLIGEIFRRIGEKEKALAFFDNVISTTSKETRIHELALRQKTNPTENL